MGHWNLQVVFIQVEQMEEVAEGAEAKAHVAAGGRGHGDQDSGDEEGELVQPTDGDVDEELAPDARVTGDERGGELLGKVAEDVDARPRGHANNADEADAGEEEDDGEDGEVDAALCDADKICARHVGGEHRS